jgi:biopolymer transport protein ExbD
MEADSTVLNQENTADWKIVELHDDLVVLKNNFTLLNPSKEWKGMVIVQADKGVDFKIIKKVMYSCSLAGYQNVNFAVQEKAKGS